MEFQSVKKQQDSPFLTLSKRNKAGLSSQNIHGDEKTKETQKTKEVSSDSIFARQSHGGLSNAKMFAQEEEQGAEQYIQEDDNGDVNFDMSGFYNDALGVNLSNSGTTDPISGVSGNGISASNTEKDNKSDEIKQLKEHLKKLIQDDAPEREKKEIRDKLSELGLKDKDIEKVEQDGQKEKVDTNDNDDKTMSDTKENVVNITAPTVEKNENQTFGNIGNDFLNSSSDNGELFGTAGAEIKNLNSTLTDTKQKISSLKRNLDDSAKRYSKASDEREKQTLNEEVNRYKKQIEEQQKKQKEAQERKNEILKDSGKTDLINKENNKLQNKTTNPLKH